MTCRSISPWTFALCVAVVFSSAGLVQDPTGASGEAAGAEIAELQDQLESRLKARRPAEFAFIERVVTLVEEGRLPLPLVISTYRWAASKYKHPFPYFVRALRIRAARIGVQI
jgi:hypothetical protein